MSVVAVTRDPPDVLREEAQPWLKWAGSKRQLVREIDREIGPEPFRGYVEPFLGCGAVFFHLRSVRPAFHASLSDANERLVRAFRGVRDDVEGVIRRLERTRYDRTEYERTRAEDPDAMVADVDVASWLTYLNRCGFNGLYRVNRAGRFNVPFGRYTNPTICDASRLRACSRVLARADVNHHDFEALLELSRRGDVLYCDPPYVPTSKTANFVGYASGGFGEADQRRLRDAAARAGRRGVRVVLSNSDTPLVRELYARSEGFAVCEVTVRRTTSCKAETRGTCGELLIRWVGPANENTPS